MARKHKARTQQRQRHTVSLRDHRLHQFQRRLQSLQDQLDHALDQQVHLSDVLLAHQKGQWRFTETVCHKRTVLQEQTQRLQEQIAHRLAWIQRLRHHPAPLNVTLAQSIQDANQHTLEQRGQLHRYPRSSLYAHWSNPPLGQLEPTRPTRPINPTRKIQQLPVNLATRTSRKQPIDLTKPHTTDLTQL